MLTVRALFFAAVWFGGELVNFTLGYFTDIHQLGLGYLAIVLVVVQ